MSIKSRILGGYLVVIALALIIAVTSSMQMRSVGYSVESFQSELSQHLGFIGELSDAIKQVRFYSERYLQLHRNTDKKAALDLFTTLRTKLDEGMAIEKNSERQQALASIRSILTTYEENFERLSIRISVLTAQTENFETGQQALGQQLGALYQKLTPTLYAPFALHQDVVIQATFTGTLSLIRYESEQVANATSSLEGILDEVDELLENPEYLPFEEVLLSYSETVEEFLDSFEGVVRLTNQINDEVQTLVVPITPQLLEISSQLSASYWDEVTHDSEALSHSIETSTWIIGGLTSLVLTLCLIFGWVVTKRVVSTIDHNVNKIQEEIEINKRVVEAIEGGIQALQKEASDVFMASEQLNRSSQIMADGAANQAASVEQTSATLVEISTTIKSNSETVEKMDQVANGAMTQVDDLLANMEKLKDSSGRVTKITKDIDEIAFQTNLLALNAAVEAARAGAAGKGFAVVASEVRSLASRSANLTKEISSIISLNIHNVDAGVHLSREVAGNFRSVRTSTNEVSVALREQVQGIQQISSAVSQIDQSTQESAHQSTSLKEIVDSLETQAANLKQLVNHLVAVVDRSSPPPEEPPLLLHS